MKGSIRQRGPHSFQVRVYLKRDPVTGTRRYATRHAKTRAEAKALRDDLAAQLHAGTYAPPTKASVGEFLSEWLDQHVRGHREASTIRRYENIVRQVQDAPLGAVSLRELSPQHLEAYYTFKRLAGLSGTTVRGHHRVLSSALTRARKWGRIARNPAQDATAPQTDTEETPSLDEEQLRMLLGRAKRESPYYALYLTAAATGMRSSELAGLCWKEVDLRKGIIHVRQAFLRVGNEEVWKRPKSKAGRRSIPVRESIVGVLREVAAEQGRAKTLLGGDYHDLDLVFCQATGKPLWMRNVLQRDFYPLLERCGLPRVWMHSLRHSFVSTGARAGVDPAVMQRLAGHSSITVTMGIYRHVLETEERDAAHAIGARLLGSEEPWNEETENDGQVDGQLLRSATGGRSELPAEQGRETAEAGQTMTYKDAEDTTSGNP